LKSIGLEQPKLKLFINIVILGVSLWGVAQKDFTKEESSLFQTILIEIVSPIQGSIVSLRDRGGSFFRNYVLLVGVSRENADLKDKVEELESEIFNLQEIARENKRLKDLLRFGEEVNYKKVLAQVVGWDSSSQFRVLRINKGKNDGITLRSPVVTAKGLVGQIYRVTPNYADVLTILDPNNRVDAIVDRTRSHGILEGFSDFKCLMKYVTRTEQVRLSDVVITAGLGNIYPKGIKVGTISKIERESYGITQIIEVSPSVDFQRIEELIVLVGNKENGDEKRVGVNQ
jgi:rod shape-determining protein MreC